MRLFKRFQNIVKSNINDKLDRLENPQKMIRLMISEIDSTIIDAKRSTTERIASRTLVEQELKEAKGAFKRWENRIQLAVEKGSDELAREAIVEKNRINKEIQFLEKELAHHQSIVESMQQQITALETKRQEVKEKERLLLQRASHAQDKKKILKTLRDLEATSTLRRFSQLEEQIELLEAEAKVEQWHSSKLTKDQQFSKMEEDEAVENELAKLKAKQKEKENS
ncbi:MAG: PspA/IM30 family protein [Sphaerochaetaceae bacterium]